MRLSNRIISFLLCFATVFSLSVVSAFAVDGEYDFEAELDKEFVSSTVPALVAKLGVSNMVGYDYSSDGYANVFADILNSIAEVQDNTRELYYSGTTLPPKYEYEFARDHSDLGKYFRTVNSILLSGLDATTYYFRLPASEIQSFSDDLYELLGVRLQGTYVNSAGGYVYRVIFDKSKISENLGNQFYYMGLKYFLALDPSSAALNILDPLGVLDWNGLIDRLIGGLFEQSKFLTAPNGCLLVGVQGDSAATTENKYYENTNKTEVNVEGDTSYNVEIKDSGNTTTNIPIDLSNMQYYDVEIGEYQDIETLNYDAGDRTYTVNNHYEITFHYNYTYYIQIGASEEYVGAYEVYFELPDGRNSKDLTEDEIFGLAKDAGFVNFDVANENPNLLGLWPMDGNLTDTSAGDMSLSFVEGASSTYLETDNFGGSLFIPSSYSKLSFSGFPSSSRSSFTLQFRLYITGNFSNYSTSSVYRIDQPVLILCDDLRSGNSYQLWLRATSTSTAAFYISNYTTGVMREAYYGNSFSPCGTWSDVCIVSDGGYMAIWVNGVKVFYQPNPNIVPNCFEIYPATSGAGDFGGCQIDNVRFLNGALYSPSQTDNIPVTGQPFDTNKVLVLPEKTSGLTVPTIAVYSDIPVGETRIGGVRPSIPKTGDVYCYVENNRITSIQQHDGSGWLEVGGMIWTGSKWVDPGAYDVIRYAELWDISDDEAIKDAVTTTNSTLGKILDALTAIRDGVFSRLDTIIQALGGSSGADADCVHEYTSKVTSEPGCIEPGYQTYTCSECGHQYTEIIDAHGHDWIVTGSVPDVLDEEGNVIEKGYDELTCSVCDTKAKDYGDGPEEQDLFDALGDFIADGITWILDKLTELVDALKGITDIFSFFVEKIKTMAGDYPAFFGAFVALIPEELATLMWFAVVAFVVVAVWKKWSK